MKFGPILIHLFLNDAGSKKFFTLKGLRVSNFTEVDMNEKSCINFI